MRTLPLCHIILVLCLFLSTGCNTIEERRETTLQTIHDRNHKPIYRARIPSEWIRRDPLPEEQLADTTKAICEFIIYRPGSEDLIRITIHNFPSDKIEDRIPPSAQIARWQRQFELLLPHCSNKTAQAFSGYLGLMFIGSGILNGKETTMVGFSMQLAPEHYRTLSHPLALESSPIDAETRLQMRSDVTIKAVGPKQSMNEHQDAIINMARSFELIDEIPHRT